MSSTEWYYDASTSPTLRVISHLPPAGLGSLFVILGGVGIALGLLGVRGL